MINNTFTESDHYKEKDEWLCNKDLIDNNTVLAEKLEKQFNGSHALNLTDFKQYINQQGRCYKNGSLFNESTFFVQASCGSN